MRMGATGILGPPCRPRLSLRLNPLPPQVGITLVGTSSILSGEGSSTHEVTTQEMLLGMGLIITSQVGAGGGVEVGVCGAA